MPYNWSPNQIKVQEWLATPRYVRTPPTQEMLADELGINAVTVSRWKKLEGFRESVNEMARENVGNSLPEVYGALTREAEKGSIQHIRTVLELVGELNQVGTGDLPLAVRIEYVNDWRSSYQADDPASGSA